jgi:hypothetical protein
MQSEMERLDLNHATMTKVIGDKLYLAPVDGPRLQRVLDIGTGTGICKLGVLAKLDSSTDSFRGYRNGRDISRR